MALRLMGSVIHEWVVSQAARAPEALALEGGLGEGGLTYGELVGRASRLAGVLREAGVGVDSCVPVLMGRSVEQWVGVLGVLMAGGAYVPLDPAYPVDRIAYVLEDVCPRVVLVDEALRELVPWTDVREVRVGPGCLALVRDGIPGAAGAGAAGPDSLAYVIYTSGSTGRPKGVAMVHGALANLLEWQQRTLPMAVGERTLQYTSLSFDVSFQEVFSTWIAGGTVVLVSEEVRRDPRALWAYMVRAGVTRLYLPFVALQQLAMAATEAVTLPTGLREVITAGEQLTVTDAVRRLFRRLPGVRLHNHYGPAETHVVTALTLGDDCEEWPVTPSIGRPIDGVRVCLLDGAGRAVPTGEEGELYLGGACLARGYLNNPALTSERFAEVGDWGRLYRTGDLGRFLADGNLQFLGRADDQVKIRGMRVELGEVESVLRLHPAVADCVASAFLRDGERRLAVYVVRREGREVTASELREHLRGQLPEHMIPSAFGVLDRVPLTPSGKANRRALPDPTLCSLEAGGTRVAAESELETTLARVWSEVLGVGEVGVEDNFFDLGGTSLGIVTLQQRLREVLQQELEVTVLFQYPTVRSQARYLAGNGAAQVRMEALRERGSRQRLVQQSRMKAAAAVRRGRGV